MANHSGSKHVVVVGAGMGGLAAAVVLAARGVRVTLVESAPGPGGKASEGVFEGVSFDTGPSMLTLPGVLDTLLGLAGQRLADHIVLKTLSPTFRYLYPDGVALDIQHRLSDTLDSVRQTLGIGAAEELRTFLAYAQNIWETAAPTFVFADAPSLGNLLTRDLGLLPKLPRIDGTSRMWSAITKRVKNPYIRTLLARYATYNGSDVRCAPATLNCIAWVELGLGGFGVQGGMHAIAQALATLAESQGVELCFGARVERIELSSDNAVRAVVMSDGRRMAADAVVANADVVHTFQDLLPAAARIKRPGAPSMSGWTAIVRARPSAERVAHMALFPSDYMAEFADIFDRNALPSAPTVYVCDQHLAHGRANWSDGSSPLFVMVNAPPLAPSTSSPYASPHSTQALAHLRDKALSRLRQAHIIDPADTVIWERSPAGLAAQFPGSFGSIYGLSSNSAMSAFYRPANRVKQVNGLYLASGSAHPGGGIPMCLTSGMLAARAYLQDFAPASSHFSVLR